MNAPRLSMPRGATVSLLAIAFLGLYGFLNSPDHPVSVRSIEEDSGGYAMLNVMPYYDAATAYTHLFAYSQETLDVYRNVLFVDMLILIPLYALFFSLGLDYWTNKLVNPDKPAFRTLVALPFIAGGLNYAEDVIAFVLIGSLPDRLPLFATLSGYLTAAKSLLILLCFLGFSVMSIVGGWRAIRSRVTA